MRGRLLILVSSLLLTIQLVEVEGDGPYCNKSLAINGSSINLAMSSLKDSGLYLPQAILLTHEQVIKVGFYGDLTVEIDQPPDDGYMNISLRVTNGGGDKNLQQNYTIPHICAAKGGMFKSCPVKVGPVVRNKTFRMPPPFITPYLCTLNEGAIVSVTAIARAPSSKPAIFAFEINGTVKNI